jgi:2-polyprenyl-3-methyl-5-hydroxy-6-metoxy-1,4-benzoquinol methylase
MAGHRCPVWVGYFMLSPLRRLAQSPGRILGAHVREGMNVLDIGCAMGFFSLPMARMVGPGGRVTCVDVQAKMIESLAKRAARAGLADRIDARICSDESLCLDGLDGSIDFALAFAVVHEVRDPSRFFEDVARATKPGGRLLFAEPRGRVSEAEFEASLAAALRSGFEALDRPRIARSRAVVLGKAVGAGG